MQSVIQSHFNELRRKKGLAENRDISIRAVARETGIAHTTLLRIAANGEEVQGIRLSTVNALCVYFGVNDINELIQFKQ
ncbi:hypothetical protein IAD21_01219 [Abditibacteriota bacterium]|nr:hypothetical protein IAD21_01219 [Abditibacteriota bacterium]